MTARSTRGTRVYMTTAAATSTTVSPTAISSAAPAVVTATGAQVEGSVVFIPAGATGMPSLDNQYFVVSNPTATTFELLGSDTTGETYDAGTPPDLLLYDSSDLVLLCLASLTRNAGTPTTTSVATFCDPTATLASATTEAGTFDFTGYVDVTQPDYQELVKAYDDGNERIFEIVLPGDNGYLVFAGTVSSLDLDIPVDGALGYSGTITLSGRPEHRF